MGGSHHLFRGRYRQTGSLWSFVDILFPSIAAFGFLVIDKRVFTAVLVAVVFIFVTLDR